MRNKIKKEKLALILASFWLTVFVVRSFLFLYAMAFAKYPGVVIGGYHIHHYVFGFFTLFTLILIYILRGKRTSDLRLVLLGISFGLVVDEASFWFFPRSGDYWAGINLAGVLAFGFFLAYLFVSADKEPKESATSEERNQLPEALIKTAEISCKKMSYLPLLILAAFLFSLFCISNPAIGEARIIKPIKNKILYIKKEILEYRLEKLRK